MRNQSGLGLTVGDVGTLLAIGVVGGVIAIAWRFVDKMDSRNVDTVVNAFGTFLIVIGVVAGIGVGLWFGMRATGGSKQRSSRASSKAMPHYGEVPPSHMLGQHPPMIEAQPTIQTSYTVSEVGSSQNAEKFF